MSAELQLRLEFERPGRPAYYLQSDGNHGYAEGLTDIEVMPAAIGDVGDVALRNLSLIHI